MFRFLKLSNMRIRARLVTLFIMTGLFPLVFLGIMESVLSTDAFVEEAFKHLNTVREIRKQRISSFFEESYQDLINLAETSDVKNACGDFLNYYHRTAKFNGADFRAGTEEYLLLHNKYREFLKNYVDTHVYADAVLISPEYGYIMFSASGNTPDGASLAAGNLKSSGLAGLWRQVMETRNTAYVDFFPHYDVQAAFIGYPVYNDSLQVTGVLALQLTSDFINAIMDSRVGMGETGESYLIRRYSKEAGGRYEFRSDLKTMGDGSYVIGFSMDHVLPYWKDAVESGTYGGDGFYEDSEGKKVLVSYCALDFLGVEWALISKIDRHEVIRPIRKMLYWVMVGGGIIFLMIAAGSFRFAGNLTKPILQDMEFAQAISRGEFENTLKMNRKDELGDLAKALNTMAGNLRELDWLRTGKEVLDDKLRGDIEVGQMAKHFISYMTRYLDAQVGALYLLGEDDTLEIASSYAFTDRKGNFSRMKIGEGLVGQAALEREIIIFSDITEDAPALNYGMGEKTPSHFFIAPLVFQEKLVGVFQVASVNPFTDRHRKFVDENLENVSVLFNAARSRNVIKNLLAGAQEQQDQLRSMNEELEDQTAALKKSEGELLYQQEELRVMNEELEEQTEALKKSEEELISQQEELRVMNEELEEQTESLRRSEEELLATNSELEERTEALKEQREAIGAKNNDLIRAQESMAIKAKDLEIASKYKSEFLANMSHELRTPLNSILILSQLFSANRDGNLTEKQIESATAIHSSGADLLKLINDILDLSKVEAGKIELNVEELPMLAMVGDLKRVFNSVAENKSVDFIVDVKDTVPSSILTDSHRVQQILRNMITNAFKFTQQGSVTIRVDRPGKDVEFSRDDLVHGEAIGISVIDTGIGIPEDKQRVVFEAFQQADGSTSRKYGGTGLGLSISRELAHLLGGEIKLESREGEGCTFTLFLPVNLSKEGHAEVEKKSYEESGKNVAEADRPEKKAAVERDDAASGPEQVLQDAKRVVDDRLSIGPGDKSLLLIEDDPGFAKIMKDLANERGFKCLIAEDGETGLHFADFYKPGAIMLDIGLPGIDGWTVMERLKENTELRHIPVHFISACDKSMDAMRMGAIGYLEKPVDIEDVQQALLNIENTLSKPVKKLLIVEDDEVQRESIKLLIESSDVQIRTARTGGEALEELRKDAYDCMILDLGLEDMSGFDLLKNIRNDKNCRRVPVIVYTGRDLTPDEDRELQSYAETIIIKGARSPERLFDEATLFLHRVEADMPEDKRMMLQPAGGSPEAVLSGKNILLVDDDMRNIFALSSVLEEKDMNITVARNGLESLEKLEENPHIDLVLMDIMMPQMDGYEAMGEIRKRAGFEKLPIIALTAKAMKGDRNRCVEAGASDYLAKPVDTEKLLSMMRVWLYK